MLGRNAIYGRGGKKSVDARATKYYTIKSM